MDNNSWLLSRLLNSNLHFRFQVGTSITLTEIYEWVQKYMFATLQFIFYHFETYH